MKNKRHNKILDIIKLQNVETQEMLQELLQNYGFNVTQATVSRDIKELKLIKKLDENGVYKYVSPLDSKIKQNIFMDTVMGVDYAMNTIVVKCHTGMAQAACAALDSMNYDNIVGTLAGDDTIFVLMKTEADAERLCRTFHRMIRGQSNA
ncbi:MAG: arginine repressor [Oscillospiraceae bacterium]|nr:arginine repressor [Oscillospiraceae bacterium]